MIFEFDKVEKGLDVHVFTGPLGTMFLPKDGYKILRMISVYSPGLLVVDHDDYVRPVVVR